MMSGVRRGPRYGKEAPFAIEVDEQIFKKSVSAFSQPPVEQIPQFPKIGD